MKPFRGIDISENKKNTKRTGEEFITETVSTAYYDAFQAQSEKSYEFNKKAKLPLPLRIIHIAAGFTSFLIFGGIIRATVPLNEAYNNAPYLFWILGVCATIWAVLSVINHKRKKAVLESYESKSTQQNLENLKATIYSQLGVPMDAREVDILTFKFVDKNGEPSAKTTGLQIATYDNLIFKAYSDDENLYLVDLQHKMTFPLREMKEIIMVEKTADFPNWNKPISFNAGKYKSFEIVRTNVGTYALSPYYILKLEHNGEEWGIYIPAYERRTFEELTGLTVKFEDVNPISMYPMM